MPPSPSEPASIPRTRNSSRAGTPSRADTLLASTASKTSPAATARTGPGSDTGAYQRGRHRPAVTPPADWRPSPPTASTARRRAGRRDESRAIGDTPRATPTHHPLQAEVDDKDDSHDDEGDHGRRVHEAADASVFGAQLPVVGQLDADLADDVSGREPERGMQDPDDANERPPP